MGIMRQMASLHLRGALANVTMRNLTNSEREHVSSAVEHVASHPRMAGHKSKFLVALGKTIGADYNSDRTTAEEEFQIAVWRGVVELFYRRPYTFTCAACGSSQYRTKRHKPAPINRKWPACPNCQKVKVIDPGTTAWTKDQFVNKDEFQLVNRQVKEGQRSPVCDSPIEITAGPSKYDDPQRVLDDPDQLGKFFGEFTWNYLRQQLRENSRKEKKAKRKITGRADEILLEQCLSLCAKHKVDYSYCREMNPENGSYHVSVATLQTPPEFSLDYAILLERARQCKVKVEHDHSEIRITVSPTAPSISAFVVHPEHVLVLDGHTSINDDEGDHPINQITYRTVGEERVNQDDHVALIESSDVMLAVRESLPDGCCQDVFDIYAQSGETYQRFSIEYGDGAPKIAHIASFLRISPRAVGQYRSQIKINMLANGLVPAG